MATCCICMQLTHSAVQHSRCSPPHAFQAGPLGLCDTTAPACARASPRCSPLQPDEHAPAGQRQGVLNPRHPLNVSTHERTLVSISAGVSLARGTCWQDCWAPSVPQRHRHIAAPDALGWCTKDGKQKALPIRTRSCRHVGGAVGGPRYSAPFVLTRQRVAELLIAGV